jgi:hypothetical protein
MRGAAGKDFDLADIDLEDGVRVIEKGLIGLRGSQSRGRGVQGGRETDETGR